MISVAEPRKRVADQQRWPGSASLSHVNKVTILSTPVRRTYCVAGAGDTGVAGSASALKDFPSFQGLKTCRK